MIRQLHSNDIKSINSKGRDFEILNTVKTAMAFLGLIAWMLVCWMLISGRATI